MIHRLGTQNLRSIKMADRILLLDQGTLVAEGAHQSLMKQNTLYSQMFESQANAFSL